LASIRKLIAVIVAIVALSAMVQACVRSKNGSMKCGALSLVNLNRVKPKYPPAAREARVQGRVESKALVGKDGHIKQLEVVSGHPMLREAAVEAVSQWRYKPYRLNGQAVEVETRVMVNFVLPQKKRTA